MPQQKHSPPSGGPFRYEVVPYDSRWPAIFERERVTIAAALGERAVAIEHFGSTAVPGLAAKPIVDILVGLARLGRIEEYVSALRDAGYRRHPQGGAPDRHTLSKDQPAPGVVRVHLHLVAWGTPVWTCNLLFRNHLRTHPETAHAYADLKQRLAAQFPLNEAFGYSDGKRAFCAAVIAAAEATQRS